MSQQDNVRLVQDALDAGKRRRHTGMLTPEVADSDHGDANRGRPRHRGRRLT